MQRLLNEKEAAELLNVSVKLLRKFRGEGQGPAYLKLGRLVRYSPEALERYVAEVPPAECRLLKLPDKRAV